MKINVILLTIFTLLNSLHITATAQNKLSDATLHGHVLDSRTKEHMPFVNVALYRKSAEGKQPTFITGTATDESGHYVFNNAPEGELILKATMVGYEDFTQTLVVNRNKSLENNIHIVQNSTRLREVVVSANRYEVDRTEVSTIVNVLKPEILENTNALNLAEGLVYQPGLRVENTCQNCGVNAVRINGLEGKYSQILIDSRPVFSSLAGVYGLEQIPTSMIDRVEVIRGGGSALFGANAIGGVVNIITREPVKNSLEVSQTISLINSKAWDNVTSMNASLVSDDRKAGAYIYGTSRTREGYDHDDDGFTELGKLRTMSIGMRSYYKINNYNKVTLEYHNTYEFRRGGDSIDLQPHQSQVAEQAEHHINGGSLTYDYFTRNNKGHASVFTSLQQIQRNTYYGTVYDLNAYGTSDDFSMVSGGQFNYSFDKLIFMPANMVAGVEYSVNNLTDIQLAYNRILEQNITVASAFAQNEWSNERVGLLVGVRADKHNMMEKVVLSPRANIRLNFLKDFTARMSYSSGFRAPQAFDEDLHIMAVGGEMSIISLDPNLRPEYSGSVSGSIGMCKLIQDCDLDLLVEGFHTQLNDVFILVENGIDADGNLLLTRTNGSGATVTGMNLEASASWSNSLSLQAGMTLQRSLYMEPEQWSEDVEAQTRMHRTPDLYGFMTAQYTFLEGFKVALSGTYTGPMLVQHFAGYVEKDEEVLTESFFDLNLKMSYDMRIASKVDLQVNCGIRNIFNSYQSDFDKGADRDAGFIYGPNQPRTIYAGLKFSI